MNPSAADWIKKFLNRFEKQSLVLRFNSEDDFYAHLKSSGFIYGVSIAALPEEPVSHLKLSKEEFTKINLFHGLLFTYLNNFPDGSFDEAIDSIVLFYKALGKGKTGFLQKLVKTNAKDNQLEHILSARLQETNTVLKKNSTSLITFALLYMDILSFKVFLSTPKKLTHYTIELESTIINCCFLALRSKERKNKYDKQLVALFESSSSYLNEINHGDDILWAESATYLTLKDGLEKKYLLDLCTLAVNDDHVLDASEFQFLQQLTVFLDFSEEDLKQSIKDLSDFSEAHSAKIQLFEYSNPVHQFYKQSSETVKKLILRNKVRLTKELEESGELMVLLGQSAVRDLTSEEKTKVKDQLLDICKTIPSLTIFLLPGGTVLLPLLVKFIPKILPSSFQDNRIDTKKRS
ncbi:LETM1-related biofilm-associated protein [Ulvibacter antarcticus]|uniref:LETM1-like protein n=1 Tax=Ulvibacter antarcticus TaxID=442714 RepID=A0A3L9YY10_9FLAO|nr:LETM1-related biofilm-associated protein [Ulvibacter antarcticus]RMA64707.1 LETM1-like protein [Ulvibacter antarcticus]